MTTAHTPGPWVARLTGYTGRASAEFVVTPLNSTRAVAHIKHSTISPTEANARLIAAAPDLLLALETLLFNALHGNGLDALQQGHAKARAAIDKATQ